MSKKKEIINRKVPLNLSVTGKVKYLFEKRCDELGIDKNAVAESLLKDFLA